jgi:demethylmenaquinone methyltransferase/2-methoxy-6-polyprenyl-1,4-benzoquinol methylase
MIEICEKKYTEFPNISFYVQDVEELIFPSERFDVVTCFRLFPHIENKVKALSEINRVLKQAGKLLIFHASSKEQINEYHHNCVPALRNDFLPEDDKTKQLLIQTGFTKISIKNEPGSYVCKAIKQAEKKSSTNRRKTSSNQKRFVQ